MARYKILSVGGSIIIPKTGFDVNFLKKFRSFIIDRVKKGEKFILVIGGGSTARVYQDAARKVINLSERDLDWVGIAATQMNASFVRRLFGDLAYEHVVTDPRKKISTKKSLILAAGWQPGCSTDYDTVLLAKTYGAKELINLSNIEYVYNQDPGKFKDAKKIESIDWKTFRKEIVGSKWEAGKNAPFDPVASREAHKLGLRVSILKGTNLTELKKALSGQKFKGTIIR